MVPRAVRGQMVKAIRVEMRGGAQGSHLFTNWDRNISIFFTTGANQQAISSGSKRVRKIAMKGRREKCIKDTNTNFTNFRISLPISQPCL